MDAERIEGPWEADGPTYEQVWQAITGRDEPWGGCADRDAVERVMALVLPALVPTDLRDLRAEVERLTAERDALAAALAEQTARADHEDRCAVTAQRTADRLAETVERVRGLHRESRGSMSALYPYPICECGQDYPCPTVRALDEGAYPAAPQMDDRLRAVTAERDRLTATIGQVRGLLSETINGRARWIDSVPEAIRLLGGESS